MWRAAAESRSLACPPFTCRRGPISSQQFPQKAALMPLSRTAFLFDLDGTLVDSVYQHVLAWHEALQGEGISLPVWQIHRKIGMSGGLFTNMLLREIGVEITADRLDRMRALHAESFRRHGKTVRPLPGAIDLLRFLTDREVPWAIA